MADQPTYSNPEFAMKGIRKFFFGYFYGDSLEDQASVEEALEDYQSSEFSRDPGGKLLLSEVLELLAQDLPEDKLIDKVEGEWGSEADAKFFGFAYKDVLTEIRDYLRQHQSTQHD
jgi:contact-dependent growth inhibition (CDI) system CdiI-like immunity protein